MQELSLKIEKSSSQALMNSMNNLAKSMDTMLKLFTEAAKEIKIEDKEGLEGAGEKDFMNEKLNEIIDQNKTIAESMVAVSDMVRDFTEKQKNPEPKAPQPNFQQSPQQPPTFDESFNEPMSSPLDQPPLPQQQGPVAMPSIPFPSVKKPKKKGLFGRLIK
ncbi:MAG: hypothetical protein QGI89_00690 [Candidatus Woesearchaeota archaeon]|jgi:uncharacterized phage infection (PIP) family protein YhgE|nr:hypothetical protein [Candidatus Woesearchaeota archaeon]MDP7322837.1 hypothetical protein [Candidatus Woesearchaeota archaeon]